MSSRSGFNKGADEKSKPCCGSDSDHGKVGAEKGSNGCKCGPDCRCCSKSTEKINCKCCAGSKAQLRCKCGDNCIVMNKVRITIKYVLCVFLF